MPTTFARLRRRVKAGTAPRRGMRAGTRIG
jgi:hypothetical protein